jgi:hypothetical protein
VSAARRTGWSGWPVLLGPRIVRADPGAWSAGGRSEFTYRDLGLAQASAGAIGARHVRRRGTGLVGFDWHCHDLDFQFNYVIGGSSLVESEHGERHRLAAGDAICEPALHRVRELDFSADYDCIQITVPAEPAPPIPGRHGPLPARASTLDPERHTVHMPAAGIAPEGDAPVRWRDLGTAALTGGRLILRLVAAAERYRSEADWLVVLGGSAEAGPGGPGLRPFDAVSLGGPHDSRLRELAPGRAGLRALELTVGARCQPTSPEVG